MRGLNTAHLGLAFTELLKAAEHFGEFDMHRRCEQLIKASIIMENVCKLYAVTAQCKANVNLH